MDGIPAMPFRDTARVPFIRELEENYEVIKTEFEALLNEPRARFQSVTSMNYESGWKTLVLYFNGHRIDRFPYDKCPVTASILDKVPVAGRIAGFNRQQPNSGIPLHSDGNNMW
jgi:aspartyl/asparaginyl beta-hydroxylase (cupin superfamily)